MNQAPISPELYLEALARLDTVAKVEQRRHGAPMFKNLDVAELPWFADRGLLHVFLKEDDYAEGAGIVRASLLDLADCGGWPTELGKPCGGVVGGYVFGFDHGDDTPGLYIETAWLSFDTAGSAAVWAGKPAATGFRFSVLSVLSTDLVPGHIATDDDGNRHAVDDHAHVYAWWGD